MNAMIGEKLGSFRIEAVLGTGAMGVVYRGTNESTGKPAAVKVISGEIAKQGKAYQRFRREAEILQQFRHPNIVRFLAVGRFKGTSYFAMEFIAGQTLEQMIAQRGAMPWREVVDLGIQICEALHYAHEHGVVHRDLKPSNLMVSDQGQIKLTDFGIAKDLDATALTAPGRTLGTAAFMAPEQIRGTPEVSHKTDLYALGAVFYQMLTGQAAFSGASAVVLMHCHLNQPPPRPSAKVHEIPAALDDLIIKLMAKAPADRPWDAAAAGLVLTELRDKAQKGEKIAMIWPTEGDSIGPGRAGLEPSAKPRKEKASKKGSGRLVLNRSMLETALLVLALAAVGSGIAYVVWPPGQDYLFQHAKALMDSKHPGDWARGLSEYVDPLDRRFPDNPYKATTRQWRDRVLLDRAERRAAVLDSTTRTRYNEPSTNPERQYVAVSELARKDVERGEDGRAAQAWAGMVSSLRRDEADERPWWLLAEKRAGDLKKVMDERRDFVAGQIQKIKEADRAGNHDDAAILRKNLQENYGRYADLGDLLREAGPPQEVAPGPSQSEPPPPTAQPTPPPP
jgi:serine/threonine-protein kinase